MPGHARRYVHDEFSNSDNSTISSASGLESAFSGSGSASIWSIPRSRSFNARRATDGPRRSGSSFRVSMRPKGNRQQQSNRDANDEDRMGKRSRRVVCFLAGVSLVGVVLTLLEPSSNAPSFFYEIYDKLSSEDVVAQGKMSALSDEESMLLSLPTAPPGTRDDVKANFVDVLNRDQQALIEELSREAAISLRGNSLAIVDEEDRLPPKKDLDMNLDAYNFSEPTREDWGPVVKKREDGGNQTTVAYILPVFSCYSDSQGGMDQHANGPNDDREFMDAALMLQASIHNNSVRTPNSQSAYDYEMVALVHRNVEVCAGGVNRTAVLERIGYRAEVVREPIHPVNILNEYLQKHAPHNNGESTGMYEMIRLYAFKMIEYRVTVLVDFATFILHRPDAIFDALLNGPRGHQWAELNPTHIVRDTFYPNGTISHVQSLPIELDIMFTRDYSSLPQNGWTTGISLSFVPIRPSIQKFQTLINIYQRTDYDATFGWDGRGYAHYEGSMQTKGLLTYFYSEIEPHRKLELHRCIYNNLADVPFIASADGGSENCRDVKEHKLQPDGSAMPCTDCRQQDVDEIVVANYGICRPPWVCPFIPESGKVSLLIPTLKMCRLFHKAWFDVRKVVEDTVFEETSRVEATGNFHQDVFHGYCQPGGSSGGIYQPMVSTLALPHGFGGQAFMAHP